MVAGPRFVPYNRTLDPGAVAPVFRLDRFTTSAIAAVLTFAVLVVKVIDQPLSHPFFWLPLFSTARRHMPFERLPLKFVRGSLGRNGPRPGSDGQKSAYDDCAESSK